MTAVTLAGVILSLNRNMLLGLGLGLCAAALVAPQRHRFVVLAAVLGIGLSGFVLLAQDSAVQSNAIVSRIASITNYSELQKQTLDDRYYENRIALQRIHAHSLSVDSGRGTDYGARLLSSDGGFLVSRARPFHARAVPMDLMRTGLIGLLALVGSLALGIWNGARWCRARHGTDDAWLGAGVVVALVALVASSNAAIYLTPPRHRCPWWACSLAAIMQRRSVPPVNDRLEPDVVVVNFRSALLIETTIATPGNSPAPRLTSSSWTTPLATAQPTSCGEPSRTRR
jgi:hypothetical protein